MAATTEPLLVDDLVHMPSTPPPQRADLDTSQDPEQPIAQTGTPRLSRSLTPSYDQLGTLLNTPQANLNQVSVQHAVSPTTSRLNAAKDLPNPDDVDHAGIDQLRQMAKNLIKDLTEARISTANTKLQHNLLALETAQAAERAEVENQLTRRQVDHLRLQMRQRTPALKQSSPAVAQPSQAQVDSLTRTCKALEDDLTAAEEQQQRLQRIIDLKQEYIETLNETNSMLKARIIENRRHMTRFREQSPIFTPSREAYTTPRRKSYSRFTEDTPFAALIAADQILSQETASVPSTPTKTHHSRFKGHTRNVQSLSSLHTPHSKGRPSTADGYSAASLGTFSAPGSQLVNESAVRERQDRDSTISISDVEDNDDDDVQQSQASSLATNMLRRNPGSHEQTRQLQDAEKSSNLLQSKLFGPVTKSKPSGGTKNKRSHDFDDIPAKTKRVRAEEGVGLGIAS